MIEGLLPLFIGNYLQTYHQSSTTSDAVKGLSYCVLLYIRNCTEKEEKVEKREWKRRLPPFFHHKEKKNCLWQMGSSQSQDAINKMSTVLLTITCSIRGVFKCLHRRHNLFFVTIYYQNKRSTWECSGRRQCQAES